MRSARDSLSTHRLGRWVALLLVALGSSPATAAPQARTATPASSCGPALDLPERPVGARPVEPATDGPDLARIESLTRPESLTAFDAGIRQRPEKRLGTRASALLLREIAELERLLDLTPQDSFDRPSVVRRLFLRHDELARVAAYDERNRTERARWMRGLGATSQAALLEADAGRSRAVGRVAYRELVRHGEAWLATAEAGAPIDAAEVLLTIATQHELASEALRARRAYERALAAGARSVLRAEAVLGLAELDFAQARTDATRWPLVEVAYRELSRTAAPTSRRHAYVRYKLAHALWQQGRVEEALGEISTLVAEEAQRAAESPDAVADAAERDALTLFVLGGGPGQAPAALGRWATSPEHLRRLLDDLAELYRDTASADRAFVLHRTLALKSAPPEACRQWAGAVSAALDGDLAPNETAQALRELLDAAERVPTSAESAPERLQCREAALALGSEAALRWHERALGGGGDEAGSGATDPTGLDELLARLVVQFSPLEFTQASFPRLTASSWPTHATLRHARASLALAQNAFERCGELYAALERDEDDPMRQAEAAAASAACYASRLASEPTRLSDDTLHSARSAFERYACRVRTPAVGSPRRERHAEIALSHARLLATDGLSPSSVAALRRVAIELADTAAGLVATELYARRIRDLAAMHGPPEPRARAQARADARHLAALRCGRRRGLAGAEHHSAGADPSDPGACRELVALERQLDQWEADDLYRSCTGSDPPTGSNCRSAAERYRSLWDDHFAARCRAGEADCDGAATVLSRGAHAAERASAPSLALTLLTELVDPRVGLAGSVEAQTAALGIARAHHALGARDVAAAWYERFALAEPTHDQAPTASAQALLLQLELGSAGDVVRVRQGYEARYRGNDPALDAEVDLALGAWLTNRGAWAEAGALLRESARAAQRLDRPDLVLQAHAHLGRAASRLGQSAVAAAASAVGCSAWPPTHARLDELVTRTLHPADRAFRERRIIDAAAELLTGCADAERNADRPPPIPGYRGAPAPAELERFVAGELGPWLESRRRRIERLAQAYERVLELPSPGADDARRGAVRGAVARLWLELGDELRRAAHPADWNQLGLVPGSNPPVLWAELRAAYHELVRARALAIRPALEAACRAASERVTSVGREPGDGAPEPPNLDDCRAALRP